MIYFDNAASTQPENLSTIIQLADKFYANPDALHKLGHQSFLATENAEKELLQLTNAEKTARVIWTSGATEALNLAIFGFIKANFTNKDAEIITTKIEHKAVLECLENYRNSIRFFPLKKSGVIDLEKIVENNVLSSKTKLIIIHHVNNEIGIIQPLEELAKLRDKCCPQAAILVDASQSFGKRIIDFTKLKLDMLVATAHKFHGLNGTGFLQIKKNIKIDPIIFGGGQQANLRSGTMNTVGILALVAAAKNAYKNIEKETNKIIDINSYLREHLLKELNEKIVFHATFAESDPHILSFAIKGFQGAILMRMLGEKEIIVGTGSACMAETPNGSFVLSELKVERNLSFATLRLSFSKENSIEEAVYFVGTLVEILKKY